MVEIPSLWQINRLKLKVRAVKNTLKSDSSDLIDPAGAYTNAQLGLRARLAENLYVYI